MNRPKLAAMTAEDLKRYADFIDWQLIRVPAEELPYWEREAEAINIEAAVRHDIRKLNALRYQDRQSLYN